MEGALEAGVAASGEGATSTPLVAASEVIEEGLEVDLEEEEEPTRFSGRVLRGTMDGCLRQSDSFTMSCTLQISRLKT